MKRNETYNDEIDSNNLGWYIVLPQFEKWTCCGLLDKYVGFKAVECIIDNEKTQVIVIHETGSVGWAAKNAAKKVTINGIDETNNVKQNGEFYTVNIKQKHTKGVLVLEW